MKSVKAGMILVPKPEFKHLYPIGYEYTVTVNDEKQNGTIGEKFMIK